MTQKTFTAIFLTLAMSGCVFTQDKPVTKPVAEDHQDPIIEAAPLKVSNRLWLGSKSQAVALTDPLPKFLQQPGAVKVNIEEAQVLPVVLGRIEAGLNRAVDFEIEERAPRTVGEKVDLPKPALLKIKWGGPLSGLLDAISAKTGYRWAYSSETNKVTFYRYHDQEYADNRYKPNNKWKVDPAKHKTLKDVLASWCKESNWELVWADNVPNYRIGAVASFPGTFEDAVTALADANKAVAPLTPWFYHENNQLVIRPVKRES